MPTSASSKYRAILVVAPLLSCTTTLDPAGVADTGGEPGTSVGNAGAGGERGAGGDQGSDPGGGGAPTPDDVELAPCETVETGRHLLCARPLAFSAAAHDCSLRGGYLAEIGSAGENDAVAAAAGDTVGTNVWLGGTRTVDFVWSWHTSLWIFWRGGSDGTPAEGTYVNWAPDEPNDSSTVSDEPEKCLALTLGGNDWNDRACSLELPYACELD